MEFKEFHQKIIEVMTLAFNVNTETDYCVFTRDAGHVSQIEFEICVSKEQYVHKLKSFSMYYDYEKDEKINEFQVKKLLDLETYLKKLLTNPKIPFYKVTYDFGITQVSKVFENTASRDLWIKNAGTNISKEAAKVEPKLEIVYNQGEL